ncbi:MAG: DEAD/DEAH box helicase, partial [Thiohalospira sp.]
VEFDEATGEPVRLDGLCSCPVEFNCKHVVSACLGLREQMARTGSAGLSAHDFGQWLAAACGTASEPADPYAREHLLFHLGVDDFSEQWRVALRIATRRRKDGQFNRGRSVPLSRLRLTHGEYAACMREGDSETLDMLAASATEASNHAVLRGAAGAMALERMLATDRLFLEDQIDREKPSAGPASRGETREVALEWNEVAGGQLQLEVRITPGDARIIPTSPPHYVDLDGGQIGPLNLPKGMSAEWLERINNAPMVSRAEAEALSREILLHYPWMPTPAPVELREIVGEAPVPELVITLVEEDVTSSRAELRFIYDDLVAEGAGGGDVFTREVEGELVRVQRDAEAEGRARERLSALGLEAGVIGFGDGGSVTSDLYTAGDMAPTDQQALQHWITFLGEGVATLESEGWRIEWQGASVPSTRAADAVEARVDEGSDWFDLQFDMEVDGRRVPLLPLVTDLIGDYEPGGLPEQIWLEVDADDYVRVAREQIEPVLRTVLELHQRLGSGDGEAVRLSRFDAPRLERLGELPVRGGEKVRDLARNLTRFEALTEAPVPEDFNGTLRSYQQQGVNWLQFLREYDLAGVLADDMGLGKTVQTLAHLAIEKEAGRLTEPALVVAPTSLLSNWRREAEEFTPGLDVLVLHGPERKKHFDTLGEHDVIFTTYPLLPRDAEVLRARRYSFLILDEAQQIKNPRAQVARLVRSLEADHRLCLTGTPMENHLGELWALFDFLLPGFLGDREQFTRDYRTPIEKQGDSERLRQLTRRTAPFMLRRTKDVVAGELPVKSELLRTTPIEGKQAKLYESIRLAMEEKVRKAIEKKGLAGSQITILDALLKLRQVCCDPRLLPAATEGRDAPSAKLNMLMELLPEMIEEGQRILLFSQFTSMLGLIEQELKGRGIRYTKLTGQTRKRDEAIERFRSGEASLFLISLKAGGVGLNLTEADTVIHYDPWWNPAVEEQATDRVHRIGQDKPVFVYKLVTEGTVEEKILTMQAHKSRLAESVYQQGGRGAEEAPIDQEMVRALFAAD